MISKLILIGRLENSAGKHTGINGGFLTGCIFYADTKQITENKHFSEIKLFDPFLVYLIQSNVFNFLKRS